MASDTPPKVPMAGLFGHAAPPGEAEPSESPAGAGKPASTPFTHKVPDRAAKRVSQVLGEVVWLMSQSSAHKTFFIADLEWFVMTPIILQQFRLFYDKEKPIGVVFWGQVDAEVEERLAAGGAKLRPQNWKSGDRLWVTEVIAPFGGAPVMVAALKEKVVPTTSHPFGLRPGFSPRPVGRL